MKSKLLSILIEAALSDQAYVFVKDENSQYMGVQVVPLTYAQDMVGGEKYQQLLNGQLVSAPVKSNNREASLTGFYSISKDDMKRFLMPHFYIGEPARREKLAQQWNKITGDNVNIKDEPPPGIFDKRDEFLRKSTPQRPQYRTLYPERTPDKRGKWYR